MTINNTYLAYGIIRNELNQLNSNYPLQIAVNNLTMTWWNLKARAFVPYDCGNDEFSSFYYSNGNDDTSINITNSVFRNNMLNFNESLMNFENTNFNLTNVVFDSNYYNNPFWPAALIMTDGVGESRRQLQSGFPPSDTSGIIDTCTFTGHEFTSSFVLMLSYASQIQWRNSQVIDTTSSNCEQGLINSNLETLPWIAYLGTQANHTGLTFNNVTVDDHCTVFWNAMSIANFTGLSVSNMTFNYEAGFFKSVAAYLNIEGMTFTDFAFADYYGYIFNSENTENHISQSSITDGTLTTLANMGWHYLDILNIENVLIQNIHFYTQDYRGLSFRANHTNVTFNTLSVTDCSFDGDYTFLNMTGLGNLTVMDGSRGQREEVGALGRSNPEG